MINLKKKEFAIYAIALMLVAAGYFNYLNFDFKSLKTSASIEKNDVNIVSENLEISEVDEDVKSKDNIKENEKYDVEEDKIDIETDNDNQLEVSSDEVEENADESKTNIGDAVLVSSDETIDNSVDTKDYFASTKLQRNQMYAEMIKKYEDLLNNTNLSEVQKSIATEEIKKINNAKNAIMICENLILSKEFEECAILINEQSVNVIVHIDDGLNTERASQIQNIVSRELSAEIENIHISEK